MWLSPTYRSAGNRISCQISVGKKDRLIGPNLLRPKSHALGQLKANPANDVELRNEVTELNLKLVKLVGLENKKAAESKIKQEIHKAIVDFKNEFTGRKH